MLGHKTGEEVGDSHAGPASLCKGLGYLPSEQGEMKVEFEAKCSVCVFDLITFELHKFYRGHFSCSVENGWRGRRAEMWEASQACCSCLGGRQRQLEQGRWH